MAKKTTTKAKTPPARVKPDRGGRTKALVPKPNELIVRMYRQGLGDCFLLALPAKKSQTKYVLIDCGVHMRQTDGPPRLAQVMDDLVVSTNAHIDVVVATHEHADHLSGFVQKGSPFLKDQLTIGEAWLAWTEKHGDRQADTLRRKRGAAQRLIDKAVEEARERAGRGLDGKALADHLDELTDFDRPADGSVDLDDLAARVEALKPHVTLSVADDFASPDSSGLGAAKTSQKKSQPSSNELALTLLALMVGDNKASYCEPGKMREIADVPDLRAYVLGPPRSDLLEREKPTKIRGAKEGDPGGAYKEVYLTATGTNRALALSPRLGLDESAIGASVPPDWRFPFARRYQRAYTLQAAPRSEDPDQFVWSDEQPVPKETRQFIDGAYLDPGSNWRRIDGDWLGAAETLALDLAGDTNNTSLALAFEWGPPGKGRVLLFPADAQVGNWLSWRDQPYGDSKLKIENLLDRVVLYKVGHHGSHNATVRRDPRVASSTDPLGVPFGLELMNDIIAMIPVDYDAVKKEMPDPWKMPHEPLYRRLREKARLRVLRSDLALEPLDKRRDEEDVVPKSSAWAAVPGLPGVRWRRAAGEFTKGTKGPLYYDVAIALRD